MSNVELMYECQACYKARGESTLIAVEGIEYSHWHRVFPWLICKTCAEKISNALKEKEGKNE